MTAELAGRVALVTGASRNIGRAIACTLAARGAHIVVHAGHDESAAETTARAVRDLGSAASVVVGDLADPDTAVAVVSDVARAFGRLDILVNNAAIRPECPFEALDYRSWRQVMAVCLDAAYLLSREALPHLLGSTQASIVNIGGLTAHTGAVHRAHVVAAKAGLVGLTRALAHELTPRGITVNCVAPGLVDTVRDDPEGKSPAHHATRRNLAGRRGTAREVAEAVAFLAGPHGRYISGETLHVDGGARLA